MANVKQVHYDISNILKTNANFYLIWGEKSNGKSYQVKHLAIENYLKTGNRFILMRRWREDISTLWIEQYFNDVDVKKLTKGKYNIIVVYKKTLYFANVNEDGKAVRGEKIGYVMALSTEQHMSGASFLDVDMIIFEEFMERGVYISQESTKMMITYNTVDRKSGRTKLFMVGNTISRVNPYLVDWNLLPIVRKQKQGDIDVVTFHNETNDVKLAIEYCKASGGKQMSIGSASSMIEKGSWQSEPQPHLPKSKKCYKTLFRFVFQFKDFRFLCEYLQDKEEKEKRCWFVYPKYTEIYPNTFVISDKINISPYWQRDIYNVNINEKIKRLFQSFRENMIFYSDDLTGTDFKESIDFEIRR